MKWNEQYSKEQEPTLDAIADYIQSPLWHSLRSFLEESYGVLPSVEYSRCAAAPGWNVKYKRGSRALCTLYPRAGYFTCMVSVGRKETVQAELLLPSFDPYLQALYQKADVFNGGRWLMIDVISELVLENVKELIQLRVKPTKQ